MGTLLFERAATEKFKARSDLKYVDVLNLHKRFKSYAFRANVILSGPPGTGKSLSVWTYASACESPIIAADCSEDLRRMNLIGGKTVEQGGYTPFVLGPITTAIDIANEVGRCILDLEEINALSPQSQKLLNSLCDFRQSLVVNEAKEVFGLKPNAKVWVVGTMNTAMYGGVYALNADLKSRFRILNVQYPPTTAEKQIVLTVLGKTAEKVPDKTIDKVLLLAHQSRQNALEYQISTRDIVQVIEDIAEMELHEALEAVLGKFEGDDYTTVKEWIRSIFKAA
jgi:MoxR-like ATPase